MAAIVGQRFLPGLLDRYLRNTGYAGQQTPETREAGSPENLFAPRPSDAGAHGTFDTRASAGSAVLWASEHRGSLLVAGFAALLGGSLAGLFAIRRN